MRVENIMMTEDLAEKIDNLLKQASPPKMQAIAPVTNDTELNEYIAIGNLLENMGYARRLGGNIFMVTSLGALFVKNGGFSMMYLQQKEKNEKDEEIARLKKELTLLQIQSAKRDKKLVLWGIVSTLAALILSYLQFTKPDF